LEQSLWEMRHVTKYDRMLSPTYNQLLDFWSRSLSPLRRREAANDPAYRADQPIDGERDGKSGERGVGSERHKLAAKRLCQLISLASKAVNIR
jgi:hypothetical protein